MEMIGGISATFIDDGVVGERSGGMVCTGTMEPVNEATLPAGQGWEGLRVTDPPRGYHMAVPPLAVQLRRGRATDHYSIRGLSEVSDQADRLGGLLALDACGARERAAHLDPPRPV